MDFAAGGAGMSGAPHTVPKEFTRQFLGPNAIFNEDGTVSFGPAPITLDSLASESCWVAWRLDDVPKRGPTKMPYTGISRKAKADTPPWLTRAAAEALFAKMPNPLKMGGVGIEFCDLDDGRSIGGIDLDACRDPETGVVEDWAADVIEAFGSYAEVSPSGTGAKVYFLFNTTDWPNLREAMGQRGGEDDKYSRTFKRGGGKHPPAIELHLGHRFFCVTGDTVAGMPLEFRHVPTAQIINLITEVGPAFAGKARAKAKATTKAPDKSKLDVVKGEASPDLQARIAAACAGKHWFASRWNGDWTGINDTSGSGKAFTVLAVLKRAEFSYDDALAALRLNTHTSEWMTEKGEANGQREPRRFWDAIEVKDPIAALMTEFNERYFVLNENGKAMVYEPAFDPILKRRLHTRITFEDFRKIYLNRRVRVGTDKDGSPVWKPAADFWLKHPDRRQYIGGVTFDPSGKHCRPDMLNLWQGFSVEPKPGTWTQFRAHIFRIVCGGNREHFDFLMGWMARMVQSPAEQGEVAVVMKGIEGAGKGIVAKTLLRILGQHGLAISNSKHLVSNFNAHLRDTVFLFADEAFFAGDRGHVGVLKSLITEPHLTVEAKYQNAIQAPNFTHIMMASNEDWVVPASLEARRFFVLNVLPDRANDQQYFGGIMAEMEAGGYEAMLHDLLNRDLSNYNARRVPVTEGLQDQRKLSLGTSQAWWLDCLHRGYVFRSKLGLEHYFSEWHEEESTEVLFASYEAFARDRHERHPMAREAFGRFMSAMGCKPARPRNAVMGEAIQDVENPYGGTTRKAVLVRKERATGYSIGSLAEARAAFNTATKLQPDWAADGDDGAP